MILHDTHCYTRYPRQRCITPSTTPLPTPRRFLVDMTVSAADQHYNGTARAREVLLSAGEEAVRTLTSGGVEAMFNLSDFNAIRREVFDDEANRVYSYFMRAC